MEKSRAAAKSIGFAGRFSTESAGGQRLSGKVAVITGAASATEFIRNGAKDKVILADVGRAAAAGLGPNAAYTRCDVTDEAQIAAAVLYSNAGVSGSSAPADGRQRAVRRRVRDTLI